MDEKIYYQDENIIIKTIKTDNYKEYPYTLYVVDKHTKNTLEIDDIVSDKNKTIDYVLSVCGDLDDDDIIYKTLDKYYWDNKGEL